MDNMTKNRFLNLLTFVFLMSESNEKKIFKISPDYMVEKYERYIGYAKLIDNNPNHLYGLHPAFKPLIEKYCQIWKNRIDCYVRNEKIETLLKNENR
jgi:hypothetical protein